MLVEGVISSGIAGKSILEIGCGVGGVHLTLLKMGAESATGIDLAQGMLEKARALSAELQLDGRTQHLLGDFVEMDDRIQDADITILDKVLCCYEDPGSLIGKSLAKTQHIYALSLPKSNAPTKILFGLLISVGKLLGRAFLPYWHDWAGIVRSIDAAGFRQTYHNATLAWDVYVFEKATP
jgi:magnesium-protoporphyrin O-methyltransferase